jgi:hypothetical protein
MKRSKTNTATLSRKEARVQREEALREAPKYKVVDFLPLDPPEDAYFLTLERYGTTLKLKLKPGEIHKVISGVRVYLFFDEKPSSHLGSARSTAESFEDLNDQASFEAQIRSLLVVHDSRQNHDAACAMKCVLQQFLNGRTDS